MYIYIYIYLYIYDIYIYIYIYIYAIMQLYISTQQLCVNSCTWAFDVRLHITGTNDPKSAQKVKQGA